VTAFLLDTNVLSELVRPSPDHEVMKFLVVEVDLWLSVVTLHELTYCAERVRDLARRHRLAAWIETIKPRFKERLIAVDAAIAEQAARARAYAAAQGRAVDPLDALIAATAQMRSLTLATRNVREFEAFDIAVVDPWRGGETRSPR
jgi:predicted nucleic acid-binding protein